MPQAELAFIKIFNEIIESLNTILENDMNEMDKARVMRKINSDAKMLMSMNKAYGLSLLGSIAGANGDIPKMHKNHQVSLKFNSDIVLSKNYAVSMRVCGLLKESYDYTKQLLSKNQDDPTLVNLLATLSFDMGDEKRYREHAEQYYIMTQEKHPNWADFQKEMNEIKELNKFCSSATAHACMVGM
ncbi:MAG: hypothetical protein JEY79_14115 [Pseudodesulfovibrio sp.]|nr:hypothetical protein [Pseudodesulfovibrio sp.]